MALAYGGRLSDMSAQIRVEIQPGPCRCQPAGGAPLGDGQVCRDVNDGRGMRLLLLRRRQRQQQRQRRSRCPPFL